MWPVTNWISHLGVEAELPGDWEHDCLTSHDKPYVTPLSQEQS